MFEMKSRLLTFQLLAVVLMSVFHGQFRFVIEAFYSRRAFGRMKNQGEFLNCTICGMRVNQESIES